MIIPSRIKRGINRNILFIKFSFLIQRIKKLVNPQKLFHIDKIDKILAAKTLYNIDSFIETGTYLGTTINYLRKYFKEIYSIELSEKLSEEARIFFRKYKNISIMRGDSGLLIERVLKDNSFKKIFWLDAHYSAGETASSSIFGETPISKEIEIVLKYWIDGSIILIDDARLFNGNNNYPVLHDLINFVKSKNTKLNIFVDKDIIHIL